MKASPGDQVRARGRARAESRTVSRGGREGKVGDMAVAASLGAQRRGGLRLLRPTGGRFVRHGTGGAPSPRGVTRGERGGSATACIKELKRNLDASLLLHMTRWKGGSLSPPPPHPLLCFPTPAPLNFPPQGMGLRRPDEALIMWSRAGTPTEEEGGRQERRPRFPAPRGCAGWPSPEPGERGGAGAPAAPGTRREARRGEPLRSPAATSERGAGGASAPGGPGAGVAGARVRGAGPRAGAHSPSCRRRRPRRRSARSRPRSTCSRRCPAPTGRRSRAASASAAASSPLGRRPRRRCSRVLPGAGGRGGGRGRARRGSASRAGSRSGRRGRRALGAELRPGPGAPSGARAGSGGLGGGQGGQGAKGDQWAGGGGRVRAEEGMAAPPRP